MSRYQNPSFLCVFLVALICLSAEGRLFSKGGPNGAESAEPESEAVASTAEEDGAESSSVVRLEGWLVIMALGTGTRCFEKQKRIGRSFEEDFGDTTAANAFLDLYGRSECQEGDTGVGVGKIRAWVAAEAYQRGEECLGTVLSEVEIREKESGIIPRIGLNLGAETDGEILTLCQD